LRIHGVTEHHRRSFGPIHNLIHGHKIWYGGETGDSNDKTLIQQDS